MRRLVLIPCLVALLALAGGCGGGGGGSQQEETAKLARSEAQELDALLGRIEQRAAQGRCQAARENLDAFARRVEGLSDARDAALRDRLREGAANLERTVGEDCESQTESTQSTEQAPAVPEPTPETVPETVPTTPAPTTPTVPDEGEGGGEDGEGGGGDEDGGSSGGGGNGNGNGGGGTPPGQVPDDSGGAQAPGLSRRRGSGE